MITIVDYNTGNIFSVKNALDKLGIKYLITNNKEELLKASKLILPGVGAFDKSIENMNKFEISSIIQELVINKKIPTLGICIGMQILFKLSEEGKKKGLNIFNENITKISKNDGKILDLPHMGWNSIQINRNCKILDRITNNSYFYFLHSYCLKNINIEYSIATTFHHVSFHSIIKKDNIIGVQFHPERSQDNGAIFLNNFCNN